MLLFSNAALCEHLIRGRSWGEGIMQQALPVVAACAAVLVGVGPLLAGEAPKRSIIKSEDGTIEVLAQGNGPPIVLLPSLGRGAEDFDPIAEQLAQAGYRVVRPQPRGIGGSRAPLAGVGLHDYAADVAAVIEQQALGPAFVVGHAFGNRVARMLANDRPELVAAVGLIADKAGKEPGPPRVREAIKSCAASSWPDAACIKERQVAIFAPGDDPGLWRKGWHADVLAAERVANRTSHDDDFAVGRAPVLYLQPVRDALAQTADAQAYRRQFGNRVTVVVIANAGRAVIAEQPEAVSAALIDYARMIWPPAGR
jgi:pimeloyl-ACP methyl ester carboxylesterase